MDPKGVMFVLGVGALVIGTGAFVAGVGVTTLVSWWMKK
jgi:hypothetical protein